jgi:hypothetical protein
MSRSLMCFSLLCFAAFGSETRIPDTPAGRTFQAWFDAFNSGDRKNMEAYIQKYEPGRMDHLDRMVELRDTSGGFELLGIEKSEPLHVEFRVKERATDTGASGEMDVKDGDPAVVSRFGLRATGPMTASMAGKGGPAQPIDAITRGRVIEAAIASLEEYYVFPETAKKMADSVRARQKRGEYDSVTSGDRFAALLTEHFREVSHDKHLGVRYSYAPLPIGKPGAGPEARAQFRKEMERLNCGFEKAERLAGNIGYLKFNMFADPQICGQTAIAAMNFLSNVNAIIFDLRANGGGEPAMIALISSYLFAEPTHLNDLWERKSNTTQQYWTSPFVFGKRLDDKPVFVLTSNRTFSGAEEFTYNLKNLKRATIIGEVTGGGAHPVSGHRIDDHFTIGVPFARAINPITKTNWEGAGVEPDVKVPASAALETAEKLAKEASRNK